MIKKIIIPITCLLVGVASGLLLAIELFAVDVDLLAIPYSNSPVVLEEALLLNQEGLSVSIPKGTNLNFKYAPKGMHVYSIEIFGGYGVIPKTKPAEHGKYFYITSGE